MYTFRHQYVRLCASWRCQRAVTNRIRYGRRFPTATILSVACGDAYIPKGISDGRLYLRAKPKIWSRHFLSRFPLYRVNGAGRTFRMPYAPSSSIRISRRPVISAVGREAEQTVDIGIQACLQISLQSLIVDARKIGWSNDLQASAEQML